MPPKQTEDEEPSETNCLFEVHTLLEKKKKNFEPNIDPARGSLGETES